MQDLRGFTGLEKAIGVANIREPQALKDSIVFLYDTDVHQLASFIRSGPPLGRTKLMLALGLSFQAPGTRIAGPASSDQSIAGKPAEKKEKKVVEEDPSSGSKDGGPSIPATEGPKDGGKSIRYCKGFRVKG